MATPTTLPATFVAGNVLTAAQMNDLRGAFRVLQVIQTTKTDTFTTTSGTFVDVTGLTVTITPSATSSKVLLIAQITGASEISFLRFNGGNASTYIGDAASNRSRAAAGGPDGGGNNTARPYVITYLDSPATTSATTYALQVRQASGTVYINRSSTDTDNSSFIRSASSITAMEISA